MKRARALSNEEAHLVVEPFFEETRSLFIERGLPRVKHVKLQIAAWVHDTERHFAACSTDGRDIVAAPQIADLTIEQVAAIFAHEMGHAADYLYPARFLLADGELVQRHDSAWVARSVPDDERAQFNRTKQWESRGDDEVEHTADLIAEWVTGRKIRYSGRCLLQTYGVGESPRPRGLR